MCYETFQNYLCYNCGFGRSRAGCGILCRWNRAPLAVICLHYGNLGRTFGKCSRLGYSTDFGREAQKVKRMNDFAPPFAVMQAGFCLRGRGSPRGEAPRRASKAHGRHFAKMPWLPQLRFTQTLVIRLFGDAIKAEFLAIETKVVCIANCDGRLASAGAFRRNSAAGAPERMRRSHSEYSPAFTNTNVQDLLLRGRLL